MATAQLHDGASIEVTSLGDGPAILLPVSTAVVEGGVADQMRAYEGHLLAQHPKPHTLTADTVAADLAAIAETGGAQRFAYYGYSWLALTGLQLAIRTDRLTALAMGGFPPLGGPYEPMLTVTRAAHRMALANRGTKPQTGEPEPGDWDAVEVTQTPEQTQQYVTLYESLQDFEERAALDLLSIPRLAFAGADDNITYGPKWDNAHVEIANAFSRHRGELLRGGWTITLIPDSDHMSAMQAAAVLPLLTAWLISNLAR